MEACVYSINELNKQSNPIMKKFSRKKKVFYRKQCLQEMAFFLKFIFILPLNNGIKQPFFYMG